MAKFRGLNITMSPLRATASMARDLMDEENDCMVAPAGAGHAEAQFRQQDIAARTAQADMIFLDECPICGTSTEENGKCTNPTKDI
jgi:hypothetical protein